MYHHNDTPSLHRLIFLLSANAQFLQKFFQLHRFPAASRLLMCRLTSCVYAHRNERQIDMVSVHHRLQELPVVVPRAILDDLFGLTNESFLLVVSRDTQLRCLIGVDIFKSSTWTTASLPAAGRGIQLKCLSLW